MDAPGSGVGAGSTSSAHVAPARSRQCVCVCVCVCTCVRTRVCAPAPGQQSDSALGRGPPTDRPPSHGPSTLPCRAVQPHQQQMFGEEAPGAPDAARPGPCRRQRQPSMSETMPLYTLCKEDLESMDKEVSPSPSPGPSRPLRFGLSALASWRTLAVPGAVSVCRWHRRFVC